MKKITVLASMLILGSILPGLKADECSSADLRGDYSFVVSGTLNGSPFAATGETIYNGDGTAEGVIQASVGGTVYPPAPWTAKYSLSLMTAGGGQTVCVLNKTITIPDYGMQVSFFGSAGDNFKELRFIATTPGSTISGTARKQ